ncbi:MAG: YbaB/EbfC family nucleoid-associated protein [Sphingomonadales bacterium]
MKNLMSMMKQAQEMQEKMQEKMASLQDELEAMSVEGAAGAGLIKVTANGKGIIKSISVDPSLVDKEEIDVLEDLIVAACNDAKGKAEEANQEKMADLSAGLPLPPGMKLPF